jgi:hypothetical protein
VYEDLEVLFGKGKGEGLDGLASGRVDDGGPVLALLALDEQIEVQIGVW